MFAVLDASEFVPPGILEGATAALGSYDECLGIRVPDRDNATMVAFAGQYCSLSVHLRGQPYIDRAFTHMLAQDPLLQVGETHAHELVSLNETHVQQAC